MRAAFRNGFTGLEPRPGASQPPMMCGAPGQGVPCSTQPERCMMSLELWLVYLAAALGLSLTPGPNGLLALTHGARFGLGPAAWTVLGGAVGFLVLIMASLAGLGAL